MFFDKAVSPLLRPGSSLPSARNLLVACLLCAHSLYAGGTVVFNWVGSSSGSSSHSSSVQDPLNWSGGIAPLSDGTAILSFPANSYSVTFDSNFNAYGLTFNGGAFIYGSPYTDSVPTITLTLGAGGIQQTVTNGWAGVASFNLDLAASQTWSVASSGLDFNNLSVNSVVTGGSDKTLTLSAGSSTSGRIEFARSNPDLHSIIDIQSGTVSLFAANSLGDGTIKLRSGTILELPSGGVSSQIFPNALVIYGNTALGKTSNGINNSGNNGSIEATGNITLNSTTTTIGLIYDISIFFKGSIDGVLPNSELIFTNPNTAILSGTFGTNLTKITSNAGAVVFNTDAIKTATWINLNASNGGLIGVGADGTVDQNGILQAVLGHIGSRSTFNGTLSFDVKPGADPMVNTYGGAAATIDLSGFNPSTFTVGSLTAASIVPGTTIIAPVDSVSGNSVITFGGGGGRLTVGATLTSSGGLVLKSPADYPLTLVLQGDNRPVTTPTVQGILGDFAVQNSFLVFDNANSLPAASNIILGTNGYVSYTNNFSGATPAIFLGKISSFSSTSILGFDSAAPATQGVSLSGSLDLSNLSSSLYIGTMTNALTIPAATLIKPPGDDTNTLRFVAVGPRTNGPTDKPTIKINAGLLDANGVQIMVYGHPSNSITFGKDDEVPGAYIINGANDYTGGTKIYGGNFTLSGASPFGTGTVQLLPSAQIVSIAPGTIYSGDTDTLAAANVVLSQAFVTANPKLTLGNSAIPAAKLTINGIISGSAAINIVGDVTFGANNTYYHSGLNESPIGSGTLIDGANAHLTVMNNLGLGAGSVYVNAGSLAFVGGNALAPVITDLGADGGSVFLPSSATSLTINLNQGGYFNGKIEGEEGGPTAAGLVINNSTGVLRQYTIQTNGVDNRYNGATVVNNARLIVKGPDTVAQPLGKASSTITLNNSQLILEPETYQPGSATPIVPNPITFVSSGNLIGGKGTLLVPNGLIIDSSVTLSPGFVATYVQTTNGIIRLPVSLKASNNSVGLLTIGSSSAASSLTFASGGRFDLPIQDPAGTEGVGYSSVKLFGSLNIAATSVAPFQFKLASAYPYGLGPLVDSYPPGAIYSLKLVETTGGITGFDPTKFSVDSSAFSVIGFGSSASWTFSLSGDSNSLLMNFSPVPEPETWALMLGGSFAVVMPWIRRRLKASRS